jgi:hypothetical protein
LLRASRRFERNKFERLGFAAQRQRRNGVAPDRSRQGADALDERARGQRGTVERAARVEDARRGVHRVADQGDLLF